MAQFLQLLMADTFRLSAANEKRLLGTCWTSTYMKIKGFCGGVLAIAGLALSSVAAAAPFSATSAMCDPAGVDTRFISKSDVTSAGYSALNCFGVFDGNDSNQTQDGIDIGGGVILDFLAKHEKGKAASENALGLSATLGSSTGTWSFTNPVTFDGVWMLVIKQGNCWAGWTFDGGLHTGGTYSATFGTNSGDCVEKDGKGAFSHISIYGNLGRTEVPEPETLALLGLGLIAVGLARRRKARG